MGVIVVNNIQVIKITLAAIQRVWLLYCNIKKNYLHSAF